MQTQTLIEEYVRGYDLMQEAVAPTGAKTPPARPAGR